MKYLDTVVKIAALLLVAQQLALHRPQTWDRTWTFVLGHHTEIAMVGVGVGALLLACRDLVEPAVAMVKPLADVGAATVKAGFDLTIRLLLALVAIATVSTFCFIKFGPQDKGDELWRGIKSLFDLAWARAIA